jgi:hypothetical protein
VRTVVAPHICTHRAIVCVPLVELKTGTVITLGNATCQALEEGNSMATVLQTIEGQGFSGHDTGIIVGAAANTFCPDQLSTVQGFIANHGG